MRVRFNCDNGANFHSKYSETFDVEDFGYSEKEWKELSDEDKESVLRDWALERYEYWMEELP